ncbi:MAG: hypothetical protein ACOC1U_11435, partial [Spirochaetota bacterium]
ASLVLILIGACATPREVETLPPPSHESTSWEVRTAGGLEAIAFLNALVHYPLVYPHFRSTVTRFEIGMPDHIEEAVTALGAYSEEHFRGAPGSPLFKPLAACAFVYGDPLDTIGDVLELLEDEPRMEGALARVQDLTGPRNVYYTPEGFAELMGVVAPVRTIFAYLEERGFEEDWNRRIRPRLETQAAHLLSVAESYNVVPEVETLLGFSLPSDHVVFFVLEYIKPFGNHIIPGYFATEPWIPDELIVRTAVHELMHDPCYTYDPEFWEAMGSALRDRFVWDAYESRDPKFGYNNPGYYAVENSVRALDQIASERLGVARPRADRFDEREDGGMHVLAPALYVLMRDAGFPAGDEGFRDLVIRLHREGTLRRGRMRELYDRFFTEFAGSEPPY